EDVQGALDGLGSAHDQNPRVLLAQKAQAAQEAAGAAGGIASGKFLHEEESVRPAVQGVGGCCHRRHRGVTPSETLKPANGASRGLTPPEVRYGRFLRGLTPPARQVSSSQT